MLSIISLVLSIVIFVLSAIVDINISTYFNEVNIKRDHIGYCIGLMNNSKANFNDIYKIFNSIFKDVKVKDNIYFFKNILKLTDKLSKINNRYDNLIHEVNKVLIYVKLLTNNNVKKDSTYLSIYTELYYKVSEDYNIIGLLLTEFQFVLKSNGNKNAQSPVLKHLFNRYESEDIVDPGIKSLFDEIKNNLKTASNNFDRLYDINVNKRDVLKHAFKLSLNN